MLTEITFCMYIGGVEFPSTDVTFYSIVLFFNLWLCFCEWNTFVKEVGFIELKWGSYAA